MVKPKVLVTCRQMQAVLDDFLPTLLDAGFDVTAPELTGQQFSASELAPMMHGVVAHIAGDDELNEDYFASSRDLRLLVRWGIGMDSVDHAAAARHQVVVRNTPGVFGGEVADAAFGYVLMLARRLHAVNEAVQTGEWPKHEGVSLGGATLGIVGLGDIGRAVARRGLGFDMRVVAFDPYVSSEQVPHGVETAPLERVLGDARFVVLTCPLTQQTLGLIGREAFSRMRPDAFLVNVARGPVVDEAALVQALDDGEIAGAGLDVFEVEPLPAESSLRGRANVVLGAHNGSNTREGVLRASARAVEILLAEVGPS